ncbi:MAG: GGDEF domain-containing protein, partial [Deltaproteobacteria bacterium]|nr:GGDEF domain-containing protein [Deltaproteobacteria bacterium]
KRDQEIFHHALKSLNGAQEAEAVQLAVLRAAGGVAPFDLAALTLVEEGKEVHRVVAADGDRARLAAVQGRSFSGRGLVGQVVRTRHYLPVSGGVGDKAPVVFSEELPLAGVRSLLVLPLPYGEEVLGTIVFASEQEGVYGQEVRERLEVIAHSAAISIKNAQRFELIRTMATTDGLTGLVNHRQFQVRYEEAMARARRMGSTFGLLLADIDHFKSVNDTHGHPAGDEVLRAVARRLSQTVREVDLVARYGGEEFVVLLEGTSVDGARTMAERIREAVAAETVPIGSKMLRLTISLGLACYPQHGEDRELLLERADQALYTAKKGGRDQVRIAEQRSEHFRPMARAVV